MLLEQYHLKSVSRRSEGIWIEGNPVRRMYLFALCMDRLKDECHDENLLEKIHETGLPVFEAALVVYAQKHHDLPFSSDRDSILEYYQKHDQSGECQLLQPMEEQLKQRLMELFSLLQLNLRCYKSLINEHSYMSAWFM